MGGAWSSYDAASDRAEFLPPLRLAQINGRWKRLEENETVPEGTELEEFHFPADVSGEFGMQLLSGQITSAEAALQALPEFIGTDRAKRLSKITSFPQLLAICDDLLRHYGFERQKDDDGDPLAQKPSDEPSVSTEPSSTTSEPLRQTSTDSSG